MPFAPAVCIISTYRANLSHEHPTKGGAAQPNGHRGQPPSLHRLPPPQNPTPKTDSGPAPRPRAWTPTLHPVARSHPRPPIPTLDPSHPVSTAFASLSALIPTVGAPTHHLPIELPFTGAVVGSVPACSEADVRYAVTRAREAQSLWTRIPVRRRAQVILRLFDLVLEEQDSLMDLIQLESGKARRDALEEVLDVANTVRYYAIHGPVLLGPHRRRGAIPLLTHVTERYVPYGVVGLINPWNYPFTLALSDAVPALLAGNAVVLKPAESTSLIALRAALLFQEAGLPDGLLQVVTGRGEKVGPTLIESVDAVSFTGSTHVGREIGRQSGERLKPFSLELGGKNPMLVLDDAPLERTVDGAIRGCFSNAGQLCISTERLFVQDDIYERFIDRFIRRTGALRLGARFDFDADVGSLISRAQLEKTRGHVEDAVAKSAELLAGGRHRPDLGPYFFEPTILTNVDRTMRVYAEETFGPVVSVRRFRSIDEAVREANASKYGLNASVWTGDVRRGRRIAREIECGTVNVNDAYAAAWGSVDAPMGGMKQSGFGRRHGREGLLRYVESQTIASQRALTPGAPLGDLAETYRQVATAALKLIRNLPL